MTRQSFRKLVDQCLKHPAELIVGGEQDAEFIFGQESEV